MLTILQKNTLLRRLYFHKTEVDKWLIISCLFSLLLVVIRVAITGSYLFVFLPWNLFLAFIPYYISSGMIRQPKWMEHKIKFAVLSITWLLFIPNSFYILTDLFHLELREESNRWFDLTLIFSFAWNGLLLGILSVRQMERIFLYCFRLKNEFLFLYPVMWLNALGVYIGRFMRFNSWDVIANPFELVKEIGSMMFHPFQNFNAWSSIACFAVFMCIIYLSIKRVAKVI